MPIYFKGLVCFSYLLCILVKPNQLNLLVVNEATSFFQLKRNYYENQINLVELNLKKAIFLTLHMYTLKVFLKLYFRKAKM